MSGKVSAFFNIINPFNFKWLYIWTIGVAIIAGLTAAAGMACAYLVLRQSKAESHRSKD